MMYRVAAACAILVPFVVAGSAAPAQEGPPPALVVTAPVTSETITETVRLPGTVRPLLDSLVASEVEGRVASRVVENGDDVRRGAPLVRLDAARLRKVLDVARAERNDVTAQLELAVLQERRARDLHDDEVLPRHDLDEAVARRQSLEGRREAVVARIESIEDDIARSEIRAPFAGVVTEVLTEVGEWIEMGSPVARLSNMDTVEVRLEVPERYYAELERGARAPMSIDALPGMVLDGKIFAVVPRADQEARTFPVLVRATNPEGRVAAGMLARVELALASGHPAMMVPKDAIVRLAQQLIVFSVDDSGAARAVTVRTGRAAGRRVEVFGDLRIGDPVVVRGNERLQPGQPVTVQATEATGS